MKYLTILMAIVALYSCKDNSTRDIGCKNLIVDYQNTGYSFPAIIDTTSVESIQLETNDQCLLGVIKKIKIYNENIYITSKKKIYVFASDGSFKFKFGKIGRGVGEYQEITDIIIGDTIYLYDQYQGQILLYTPSGEYLLQRKVNVRYVDRITKLEDNVFAFNSHHHYPDQKGRIVIRCLDNPKQDKSFLPEDNDVLRWQFFLGFETFAKYKNNTLARLVADNTIYSLTKDSILPFLTVDFGKYTLPEFIAKGKYTNVVEFRNDAKDKYVPVFDLFCTNEYLSIGFFVDGKVYLVFYNFKSEVSKTILELNDFPLIKNHISVGNGYIFPNGSSSEYFYSIIDHSDLLESQEQDGAQLRIKPDANSNPILIKYKPQF